MFPGNRKDDDGRVLNNHRLTSVLTQSRQEVCTRLIEVYICSTNESQLINVDYKSQLFFFLLFLFQLLISNRI